jgi:hypothetical protein
VVCLGPRVPGEIVVPRPLSDVGAGPSASPLGAADEPRQGADA